MAIKEGSYSKNTGQIVQSFKTRESIDNQSQGTSITSLQ